MTENTKANCFRKARLVKKMSQRRLKKKLSIHHQTWDNGRSMTFEEYVAMDEEVTVWWELLDWDILAEVLTKKIENSSYVEEDQDEAVKKPPHPVPTSSAAVLLAWVKLLRWRTNKFKSNYFPFFSRYWKFENCINAMKQLDVSSFSFKNYSLSIVVEHKLIHKYSSVFYVKNT